MKKICLLLSMVTMGLVVWAQTTVVTGRVTNAATKAPIEGVSVVVKGTNSGTTTSADGTFSIDAPSNGVLSVSGIGFLSQDVSISGNNSLEIALTESAGQLEGVVVTALGQSRQKKSLGYATQQIGGADLQVGRENNVANSLVGRTAGVVVNRNSSGPGSSTRISLRGERSLQGNNQPLIVIDGIPTLDNVPRSNTGEFNGSDGVDPLGNLNPDDIESMNILRGPNAAALYGARANNGVIIITTKKGRRQKGIGVTYTNNTSWESALYQVDMQDQYAQGVNTYSATDENSWGPKITGQSVANWRGQNYNAAAEDHVGNLLQTGLSTNNNISFSAGNEKTQIRVGYNNLYATGILPNNSQLRHSFIVRSTSEFGKLSVDAKLNFINQVVKNRPTGGEEALNPYSNALRMPTTVRNADLMNYVNSTTPIPTQDFFAPNSAIIGNPYWMVNKVQPREERNRIIATTTLRYKVNEKINVTGRVGLDRFNDDNNRRLFAGTPTPFTSNSGAGDFQMQRFFAEELNMELFADYNSEIGKDLKLGVMLGTALRKNRSEFMNANAGGLDLPDLFVLGNGRAVTASNALSRQEIQSVFGSAQLAWKDAFFLDITSRNDWASTLPEQNRSFFYPSVSLSAILSELVSLPDWMTYAKLRGSYAFVGKEATPFDFIQTLQASQGVSGTILRNRPDQVNPDLKPEQTRSFEIGGEFRFLKNRLSIDATYYITNSFNQILRLPLPVSSGFNNRIVNAGQIRNNGFELLLNGGIVRKTNFRWDVGINFSTFRNEVVELDPQLKTIFIGSTRIADVVAVEGQRFGNMFVNGFLRDADGLVQIGTNGLPTRTGRTVNMGNVFPDWTGGINNSFQFGKIGVDFLIDGRFGGVVASHTQAVLGGLGKLPETVEGRDSRNLIVPGVLAGTKTPNNIPIDPRSYWQFVGGRGNPIGEVWVYDATNIRLRQATVNYTIPAKVFEGSFIQGMNISLYGRNLFFLMNDAPFDPEVSLNSTLGGQGIDFYSLPTTRSYGFNINVNF